MNETFRPRAAEKYVAMVCTAFFLVAVIVYLSIPLLDDPVKHGFKREGSALFMAALGTAVFGTMLLLSIYSWVAFYFNSVTIADDMIEIRSVLRDRHFDLHKLQCLKWRIYPARGSVCLLAAGAKARLSLDPYSEHDRLRIIQRLRETVSPAVQEGWPMFCHEVALPLRDGYPSQMRSEPTAKFCTITRARYDQLFLVALPLSILLVIGLTVRYGLWQSIPLPFFMLAFWLLLRFGVPREGRVAAQLTSLSGGWAVLVGFSGMMVSLMLMIGLVLSGTDRDTACGAGLVILIPALAAMLWLLHKSEKTRRAAEGKAVELAPAIWDARVR